MPKYLLSGTDARGRRRTEAVTAPTADEATRRFKARGFADVTLHSDEVIGHLFKPDLFAGTLMLWLAFFMSLLIIYLLSSWLPTLIKSTGVSLKTASLVTTMFQVGGTLGALLTGMLARVGSMNGGLTSDYMKKYVTGSKFQPLVWEQVKAILITLVLATVGTAIIAFIVKAVIGLRPSEEVEVAGLDLNEHGEEGYHTSGQL